MLLANGMYTNTIDGFALKLVKHFHFRGPTPLTINTLQIFRYYRVATRRALKGAVILSNK